MLLRQAMLFAEIMFVKRPENDAAVLCEVTTLWMEARHVNREVVI